MLSAAGIGALLSPPTLGAAAFLIAEFLRISYLQVLVMATIPTLLYYLSILLMIEADSRRLGTRAAGRRTRRRVGALTRRYRLSLHVAGRRSPCFMVIGHVGVPRGVLGDAPGRRAQLRPARDAR